MSWLNKKKGYKSLIEDKKEQEKEENKEETYNTLADPLYAAASSYHLISNPKKEENSLYQAQPNKEKLKKIL